MLDLVLAAALQKVGESYQICVHIDLGVLNGIPNAGLGCEVDDLSRPVFGERLFHGAFIRQIGAYFGEPWGFPQ